MISFIFLTALAVTLFGLMLSFVGLPFDMTMQACGVLLAIYLILVAVGNLAIRMLS